MKKITEAVSPIIKQYNELKQKHPDAVLLFRCGDFYETYDEDAKVCAEVLGITLTKNTKTDIAMAGFPYHALDTYLPKLIRAGKRVSICDQVEVPKRKIKRGITEIAEAIEPAPQPEVEEEQETEAQPAEAKEEQKPVEEMTITELFNHIRKLEAENEKVQELQIELKDAEKRAGIESQKAIHWMNRAKQAEEKLEAIKNVINN